jgi:hypothetical protein
MEPTVTSRGLRPNPSFHRTLCINPRKAGEFKRKAAAPINSRFPAGAAIRSAGGAHDNRIARIRNVTKISGIRWRCSC